MLEFLTTFRKDIRPANETAPEFDHERRPRELGLTEAEAHVAWLAGAPFARIETREESGKESPRFVSLLVPFY